MRQHELQSAESENSRKKQQTKLIVKDDENLFILPDFEDELEFTDFEVDEQRLGEIIQLELRRDSTTANFRHLSLTGLCGLTLTRTIIYKGAAINTAITTFDLAI
jgi:hypothetical protein